MKDFETFYRLHYTEQPLLVGNVWDVNSAKIFEAGGLKAVATSSAALANTHGYEDGEKIPFELLVETVKRIGRNISVPLSVDMEKGFSATIPGILENVEKLYDAGAAGINIEDSTHDGGLRSVESFQKIIAALSNHLARRNMQVFINARTDAYVRKHPDALGESIKRIRAYEAAGAHGAFVPFLFEIDQIQKITGSTSLPVSVFFIPQLPGFKALAEAGIRRISMGTSVFRYLNKVLANSITRMITEQSCQGLY
jgi:2-methylisocitrate lyase-like PEP mutase family enzyme